MVVRDKVLDSHVYRLFQPDNEPIDGRPYGLSRTLTYRLRQEYTYRWNKNGKAYRLRIEKGFMYDGASVPRAVWWYLRPDGLQRAAATVHDKLYETRGDMGNQFQELKNGKWVTVNQIWTREQCDKMFARILREANVPSRKRRMAYRAVDWFGKKAWDND